MYSLGAMLSWLMKRRMYECGWLPSSCGQAGVGGGRNTVAPQGKVGLLLGLHPACACLQATRQDLLMSACQLPPQPTCLLPSSSCSFSSRTTLL